MRELSVGDGKTNPFKLFARRAQLVITGLVHIRCAPRCARRPGPGAQV